VFVLYRIACLESIRVKRMRRMGQQDQLHFDRLHSRKTALSTIGIPGLVRGADAKGVDNR
jgi:hypothetical protein